MPMLFTAQRTYAMLENASLWEVAERVHGLLAANGIEHAVVGGVAVCLHGYRRNTIDLDLLVRSTDSANLKATLEAGGIPWDSENREFRSPSGIPVLLLFAGEREGRGIDAVFPDPADCDAVTSIEGLPVLNLAQLIQAKIACGLGDMRRTHKDFADVVELIQIHQLDGSFTRHLSKSVRKGFRKLLKHVG